MFEYYLSLGSNLGDRENNLIYAINSLCSCSKYTPDSYLQVEKISSIYKSKSIPNFDDPFFFNIVIRAISSLGPYELLDFIKSIEKDYGRNLNEINKPRVIDIDIIFAYSKGKDLIVSQSDDNGKLVIPHPRAHLRAFVLCPLLELKSDIIHPKMNLKIEQILSELNPQEIVKLHSINY